MKPGYTALGFKGGRGFPQGIHGTPFSDWGAIGFAGENVVEFRVLGAGGIYAASEVPGTPDKFDQNTPLYTYIIGTGNYDGLRRLYNVRSANRYPQIYAPFVAESAVGAFCHIGYKAEVPCEFGGFSVNFATTPVISSDLEITLHSAKGSAYNSLIWSKDYDGIDEDSYTFNPSIFLAPGDRLDLTYIQNVTFGAILYVRKLQ